VVSDLLEFSKAAGCYKTILDCSEDNVPFYEKCGLKKKEVQMVRLSEQHVLVPLLYSLRRLFCSPVQTVCRARLHAIVSHRFLAESPFFAFAGCLFRPLGSNYYVVEYGEAHTKFGKTLFLMFVM
jgi:hypothetical protein